MPKKITPEEVYDTMLYVYPEKHLRRYGPLMHQNFRDLYREAKAEDGYKGVLKLWILLVKDIFTSSLSEHMEEIERQGLKKHLQKDLHLNKATVVAGLLMVPFCLFVALGMTFSFFYAPDNNPLYHSFLYKWPLLFTMIVACPALALLISLANIFSHQDNIFSLTFIRKNILTLAVLVAAMGALTLVFGHDMIPCTLNGIFHQGPLNLPNIYQYCRTHY